MTIYSKNAVFKYTGETPFSLLDPPSDNTKISQYYKFINSVSYIYGQTKADGSIPIFFTKNIESTSKREPSPDSTLTFLDPDKNYYIVLISEENIPLEIPTNITSEEFLNNKNYNYELSCNDISCYGKPDILVKNYNNIKLNNSYSYDFNLVVNNISPSKKYYYQIDPVYSNWPAKLSSLSGHIEKQSNDLDNLGYTSGTIKSLFSYYPSGTDYSNSITYDENIDINSNFYFKNIFTILNLSIYSENMDLLFSDNINIRCDSCLPNTNRKKPIFSLSHIPGNFEDVDIVQCSGSIPLYINYSGLDPSKTYSFSFFSSACNWPSRILPKVNTISPESLYEDPESNMVYGSGILETNFNFSPVYNPFNSWPNLQYNLESFYKEKFIDNNIYNVLSLSINESSKSVYRDSIIIEGNIDSKNEDCIDTLYVKFDDTNNSYPSAGLTENNRPGSEISLSDTLCCNKDQILTATISGACCGKEYNYRFYHSNEYVTITPLSGTISFGEGTGKIGALYNLNNRPGTTVRLVIFDTINNVYAVDNIILRCPNKIPILST